MECINKLKELEGFDYRKLIFEEDGSISDNEIDKSSESIDDLEKSGGDRQDNSRLIKGSTQLNIFANFLDKLNSILKKIEKYSPNQIAVIADEAVQFQKNINACSLMDVLNNINNVLKNEKSDFFGTDFPLLYLYFCFVSSSRTLFFLKEGTMAYNKIKSSFKDVLPETLNRIENSGFYKLEEKEKFIYFIPTKEIPFVKDLTNPDYKKFFDDDGKIAATINYKVPDFSKKSSINFESEAKKLQKALNNTLDIEKNEYNEVHANSDIKLGGSDKNDINSYVRDKLSSNSDNDSSDDSSDDSSVNSESGSNSKSNLKIGNSPKTNSSPKDSGSLNTNANAKTKTLYGLPVELPDDINKENVNDFFEKIKKYIEAVRDKHIESIKNRLKSDEGLFSIKTEDAIKKLFLNNNIVIKEVYDFVSADGNTDKLKAITDEAEDIINASRNKIFDLFGDMKSTSNYRKKVKLESQITKELDNAAYQVSRCLGKIDSMSLRNNLQTIYNNSKKKAIKDDKESANAYKYSQLSRVVDSILMSDEAITPEAKIAQYYIWNLLGTNPSVQQLSKNLSDEWAAKYIGTKSSILYVPYPSTVVMTKDKKGNTVIDFTKVKITTFPTPKNLFSKKLLGASIGNNYEELAKVLIDWYKENKEAKLKVKTEAENYLNRFRILSSSMTVNTSTPPLKESLTDFVRGLTTKHTWQKNSNAYTLNRSSKKLNIVSSAVVGDIAKLNDNTVKALTPQNIALAQAFYNYYLVIENGDFYLYTADEYKERIKSQTVASSQLPADAAQNPQKKQAVVSQKSAQTSVNGQSFSSIEAFKKKLFN